MTTEYTYDKTVNAISYVKNNLKLNGKHLLLINFLFSTNSNHVAFDDDFYINELLLKEDEKLMLHWSMKPRSQSSIINNRVSKVFKKLNIYTVAKVRLKPSVTTYNVKILGKPCLRIDIPNLNEADDVKTITAKLIHALHNLSYFQNNVIFFEDCFLSD